MTAENSPPLRVVLLAHTVGAPAAAGMEQTALRVASALGDAGHEAVVLSSHPSATRESVENGVRVVRLPRLPEAPLRWRGFTGPLTHAPLVLRALASAPFDVAHAFSPQDAWMALRWRRRSGRPVVFTAADPLTRDRLADRRLRLRLVQAAVEDSDAVTAPTDELAAVVARWLAVDTTVIAPGDGAAHERLYRALLTTRMR